MGCDPEERPRLRPIDIFPFEWEGRKSLLLRDPLGYAEGHLVVPATLGPVLALMDGTHTVRDLQVAASRLFGRLVLREEVCSFLETLARHCFLEGDEFEALRIEKEEEFRASPVRPASHAGQAYPAELRALRLFLDEILAQAPEPASPHAPRALVAPHIDLSAGARAFAAAYRGLAWPRGARVVVLGTGHFLETFFSLLDKDFETPLGTVPCDRDFCRELLGRVGPELRGHDWAHRTEHSIEFQLVFLQHVLGDFYVVPLLCGSPEAHLPWEEDLLERLVTALRELADERTYFLAGVDLCHLGVRYGDPEPAGQAEKEKALAFDRRVLELVLSLRAGSLLELLLGEGRRWRVCGFGPLYLLLRVLEGRSLAGRVLCQEAVDFGPGSIVSFAAAALDEV